MKNNKGFTLIELIMVTIILGILAAVAVPRYMGTVSKAEEAAEKAVINALRAAVEDYATQQYIEKGRYDYPENPFELVEVDGYCGTCDEGMVDGSWSYTAELDLDPDSPNYVNQIKCIRLCTKEGITVSTSGIMLPGMSQMNPQMTEVSILVWIG